MRDDIQRNKLSEVKFDHSVSLLCWAYNEEEQIESFLKRATALLESTVSDYEIVLIDDGSTDRTYERAQAFQRNHPVLKIYRNEANLNVGISSYRAIQKATKEFLFWQTVDWSYDISNLRIFLEYLKTHDIVQGVRIGKNVGKNEKKFNLFLIDYINSRSDTLIKGCVSIINYLLIRFLFRIPLSDFQNVSFYPTRWIQQIKFEAHSSFNNPEGLIKSYWNGMKIKEVPINFIPRRKGVARGAKPRAIMNAVKDIFRLWFRWVILGKRERIKEGKIEPI